MISVKSLIKTSGPPISDSALIPSGPAAFLFWSLLITRSISISVTLSSDSSHCMCDGPFSSGDPCRSYFDPGVVRWLFALWLFLKGHGSLIVLTSASRLEKFVVSTLLLIFRSPTRVLSCSTQYLLPDPVCTSCTSWTWEEQRTVAVQGDLLQFTSLTHCFHK